MSFTPESGTNYQHHLDDVDKRDVSVNQEETQNFKTAQSEFESPAERHKAFVDCLERNANGSCITQMAKELKWPEQSVRDYAERYLEALIMADDDETEGNPDLSSGFDHDDEWSTEETILFDSLLAQFVPESNDEDDIVEDSSSWEEQVASFLPRRTPEQVRRRYEQYYGSSR